MKISLSGQVAVVTGASSGIGEAIAVALAGQGVKLIVVARREEMLKNLVKRIQSEGGVAVAMVGDVSKKEFAICAVNKAVEDFGRLDILVNSAGSIQAANLADADLDQWEEVINTNLMASIYTCHAAAGLMKAQGSGYIINIGSLGCRTTSPIYNSYSTSKFGLNAMTDGLRQELGPFGVRVCLLVPGTVATDISLRVTDVSHRDMLHQHLHKEGSLLPEDIAAMIPFMVAMPQRVDISEMWVRATTDTAY